MEKYLIAGLGNIGDEYEDTRHNIGFRIADGLASSLQKEEDKKISARLFTSDRYASVNQARFKGNRITIIKPATYMNLSGKAVNYWLQEEKIPFKNLLIVTDDLALPFGTLRLKKKGSDGGHNGLTDIIATLNTTEFARLRFGIGNEFAKGHQVNYVLGKWSAEEESALSERIDQCVKIIKSFIAIGVDRTMSDFNNK
jgi:PTH1 family peptidyl-tRNA hydrolase